MKISTNIDKRTQKRLVEEAIAAKETEIYGVLLRNGVDPESFDDKAFSPPDDAKPWELDIKTQLGILASLRARLEKLD
jgi:hypothetical protein